MYNTMKIKPEMIDLARAFNEARLAALHVDMQLKFHEEFCREGRVPTREVFPIVKGFAKTLREAGIPNHWIAYTGYWSKGSYGDFATAKPADNRPYLSRDLRMFPNMGADKSDMVFEKAQQWSFRDSDCPLTDYLKRQSQNTLIIDGVKDKHCIADTIETGLRRGFRIYAAMDATNCPVDQFDDYAEWFLRPGDLTLPQRSNITFTTTDEILSVLKQVNDNQSNALELLYG